METISNVQAIPNQTFSTTMGDYTYTFKFYDCDGFMAYDISIDDDEILQGYRMIYGQLLFPYTHQEVDGNFLLYTNDGTDPDYQYFNDTQFLRYFTTDEAEEWREFMMTGAYDGE